MNRENQSLNLLKAISAILIIVIHAPFSNVVGVILVALGRSGVALFFLISGYFFYRSFDKQTKERAKIKVIRTLKLTVSAYILYFLWGIFIRLAGTGWSSVFSWFHELCDVQKFFCFFILQEDVIAGHLWFLNALIVCYCMAALIGEKVYKKSALYISFGLIGVHFLLGNILPFFHFFYLTRAFYRNAWFYGIPFFILGIHMHRLYDNGVHIKDSWLALIAGASLVFIVPERIFAGYHELYIMNLSLVFSLFWWSLQNPQMQRMRWLQKMGAVYYTDIYIIQWAVIGAVGKIFSLLGLTTDFFGFTLACILVTLIGSVVLKEMRRFGDRIYGRKDAR